MHAASGMMRAAVAHEGRVLIVERPVPAAGPGELLLRVEWTAINRADTLQRKGKYDPPPGATDILGLEAVGVVAALGAGDSGRFAVGDRAMALLSGGGNADFVTVRANHALHVPSAMVSRAAAAIPETWLTAYQLLKLVGRLEPQDTVLIHAAGSGVGTAAVQMASHWGAAVVAVAGSDDKLAACTALGAKHTINYKTTPDFGARVLELTHRRGANLILDPVGGSFWKQNAEALALDGRWVVFGSMGGVGIDGPLLGSILRKRAALLGTTLRNRSDEYKAALVAAFERDVLPLLSEGEPRHTCST